MEHSGAKEQNGGEEREAEEKGNEERALCTRMHTLTKVSVSVLSSSAVKLASASLYVRASSERILMG